MRQQVCRCVKSRKKLVVTKVLLAQKIFISCIQNMLYANYKYLQ